MQILKSRPVVQAVHQSVRAAVPRPSVDLE
jgi:hypothetical protein